MSVSRSFVLQASTGGTGGGASLTANLGSGGLFAEQPPRRTTKRSNRIHFTLRAVGCAWKGSGAVDALPMSSEKFSRCGTQPRQSYSQSEKCVASLRRKLFA